MSLLAKLPHDTDCDIESSASLKHSHTRGILEGFPFSLNAPSPYMYMQLFLLASFMSSLGSGVTVIL